MANHEKVRVKQTNTQLKKHKSTAKHKTGPTLRITQKNNEDWNSKTGNKNTKRLISGSMMTPMAASLKAPMISSLTNAISRKGAQEQERYKKVDLFSYQHYL